ncbi:hypothetical protein JRO89_XS05G0257200 [Xanthoceras sorbifolium]|uniref:Chromo domain-containing protein n=1 Tax=Xanthoceras sorbifolium TaxID=99658 RepID=A0ABQ8I3D3_9ROSI|nr:hypothetical protein JRO89_XS05G0257200 [Xanthoceras sorbifolium]
MPETRSGQSYNSMDQASHHSNPSNTINEPTQTPNTFQQQFNQLSQTLGSILHRLDVIEEHSTAGGGRDGGVNYRAPRQRDGIGDNEDEQEVQLGGGQRQAHRAAPIQFRRPDARQEPLDELTKRMKVEVRFVKIKLKSSARAWWSSMEEQLRRTRQAPIVEWAEMRERLESKYLPINYDQLIYEDMLQWKQEPKASIDQYTERFHELTVRSKAVETGTQTLARYLNGLKSELRKEMLTARVYNVDEAYQLALQLEKQSNVSYYRRHQPTDLGVPRPSTTFKQKIIEETMKNGVVGDTRSKTKLTGDGPQCYKCKGFGHFAVVCPIRDKQIAYVCEKDLIFDDEAEASGSQPTLETDELEEEEEEVLQAANLPICVINRVLTRRRHSLEPDTNDWKRTNIFHTRVAHGNKALNVIIDNGSGMNVISKSVVERLNLPQQPHPTPYREHTGSWDLVLPQAEFAFNNSVNRTTGDTPFSIVYGFNPRTPVDMNQLPLPNRVSEAGMDFFRYITTLHDDVRRHIAIHTEKYAARANLKKKDVQFSVGDQVLIRLRPERFPPGSFTKLHARRAGPFPILKKLGPNAYLVDLPGSYTFSHIFNVEDLTAYKGTNVQDQGVAAETVPRIPSTPQNHNNVDDILDHQFVSTRRGGYYKFLVRWAKKPISEAVWLQAQEIQRLNPELFHAYTLQNLPESSFCGAGN